MMMIILHKRIILHIQLKHICLISADKSADKRDTLAKHRAVQSKQLCRVRLVSSLDNCFLFFLRGKFQIIHKTSKVSMKPAFTARA